MPKTPHSAADHIEASQVQLDLTLNAAIDALDKSQHGLFTKALTSSDYTLTATEAQQSGYLRITGAFAANRTITLPNNNDAGTAPRAKKYTVEHAGTGGFTLTIKTVAGTGVTIAQGNAQQVYCDGTNVVARASATTSGGGPYDIAVQHMGEFGDGAVIFTHLPTRSFQVPASFAGSRFKILEVAPTDPFSISVRKNGTQFGTIDVDTGETDATFTAASATTLTNTDVLTFVAPSPADATASGLVGTLKGQAI